MKHADCKSVTLETLGVRISWHPLKLENMIYILIAYIVFSYLFILGVLVSDLEVYEITFGKTIFIILSPLTLPIYIGYNYHNSR